KYKMETTTQKIIGYVLLSVGLLLIIIPLYQAFNVVTGKAMPPEIFKNSRVEPYKNVNPADFQKQIENAFIAVLPLDLLYQTLNITIWSILLALFMVGGKHIAIIGVAL